MANLHGLHDTASASYQRFVASPLTDTICMYTELWVNPRCLDQTNLHLPPTHGRFLAERHPFLSVMTERFWLFRILHSFT